MTERKDKLRKLANIIVQINQQLSSLDMKIVKVEKRLSNNHSKANFDLPQVYDEFKTSKSSFFTLVVTSERNDSTKLNRQAMEDYAPHELELLKLVAEAIMADEDREVSGNVALHACKEVASKKMTLTEAQVALRRFAEDDWIRIEDREGVVRLSARFIAEMEEYLKETFGTDPEDPGSVGMCGLCKKIVVRVRMKVFKASSTTNYQGCFPIT